jgi:hypothetical protein
MCQTCQGCTPHTAVPTTEKANSNDRVIVMKRRSLIVMTFKDLRKIVAISDSQQNQRVTLFSNRVWNKPFWALVEYEIIRIQIFIKLLLLLLLDCLTIVASFVYTVA